ncbi:MAG TPA: hypothetical protein IAC71_01265 [Candidatus Caccomonas pullistercoris]|nr:hypothetical protein [Candidatus Caccomonas pullistercoris]
MAYGTNLVQKYVVHPGDEASSLLPQHVALVNEDGSDFGGGKAPGNATTTTAGLVKKSSAVRAVASADAAEAASDTPTKAEFDAVVTLLNECKAQVNDMISKAKTAGQMA